jgi:recombination protein RecA
MGEVYTSRANEAVGTAHDGSGRDGGDDGAQATLGAQARAVAARVLAAHAQAPGRSAASAAAPAVRRTPRATAQPVLPGAGTGPRPPAAPSRAAAPRWTLAGFSGRLSEFSGVGTGAQLSLAFSLVREAQQRGEPVAWVTLVGGAFYPPDVAAGGVKLDALPVIFAPDPVAAARAADRLVRSGGFSAVVLDLVPAGVAPGKGAGGAGVPRKPVPREVPLPMLSRLVGLAQKHDVALVFLTEKGAESPSLGGLISLRCSTTRRDAGPGLFTCVAEALKDKRNGPGWSHTEVRGGPVGLR